MEDTKVIIKSEVDCLLEQVTHYLSGRVTNTKVELEVGIITEVITESKVGGVTKVTDIVINSAVGRVTARRVTEVIIRSRSEIEVNYLSGRVTGVTEVIIESELGIITKVIIKSEVGRVTEKKSVVVLKSEVGRVTEVVIGSKIEATCLSERVTEVTTFINESDVEIITETVVKSEVGRVTEFLVGRVADFLLQ
eukprot:2084636-Ditylum_brightwellii.AAC.1